MLTRCSICWVCDTFCATQKVAATSRVQTVVVNSRRFFSVSFMLGLCGAGPPASAQAAGWSYSTGLPAAFQAGKPSR